MKLRSLLVWISLAAIVPGVHAGALEDGMAAFEVGEYEKAMELLRPLAEQGDVTAQVKTGVMFSRGLGAEKSLNEALKWLRIAADQGSAEAEFALGDIYEKGYGTQVNMASAIEWYRAAAKRGHAGAQYRLGAIYFKGQGVSTDYVTAYAWMTAAAEQDHSYAESYRQLIADILSPEKLTEAKALAEELANQ